MKPVDASALENALEHKNPSKKMSLIRQLMPKINKAIERGLSKKEVWESLSDAGLEMSYKMFVTYLLRIETSGKTERTHEVSRTVSGNQIPGEYSAHEALEQARQRATETDYSKLMRNRSSRIKK